MLEVKKSTRLAQQGLEEGAKNNSEEEFGNRLGRKGPHVCRAGLLSPTGLTVRGGSTKDEQLLQLLKDRQLDMMHLAEVNVNWSKVATRSKLDERAHGWFECMSRKVAWSMHSESNQRRLLGSAAMLSANDAASKVMRGGKRDSTGLGCWVGAPHRGRGGMALRAACVHRPCAPSGEQSSQSVHAQQQKHFNGKSNDACP